MGYYGGDWTYDEYLNVVNKAKRDGRTSVTLDTEHCSNVSDQLLTTWAELDGYRVKCNMDSVDIYFEKGRN
jgi:hypothetical protein